MTKFSKEKPTSKKEPSKPESGLDKYIDLMKTEDLDELEVFDGTEQIKLVRESKYVPVYRPSGHAPSDAPADVPARRAEDAIDGSVVRAPLGGVFYQSASPKSPPFVKEGDSITAGQTLCIIEAMKVMNEIKADVSGKVQKVLVENGKPIESNQPLFIIKP